MSAFLCPTCKVMRHLQEPPDDAPPDEPDRCWFCGTAFVESAPISDSEREETE